MLKLNLGCGEDTREEYYNIDIRDLPNVDIICDVKQLPFKSGIVDEIIASDIYEHVSHRDSLNLLKHWRDLLREDGVLIIRSPCLDVIIQYLLNASSLEQIQIGIESLYGGQEYDENTHRTICQTKLTASQLELVGMKNVQFKIEGLNIIFKAVKN